MIDFKDLGITTEVQSFTGEKIKIAKILNKAITVLAFKIEPSKFSKKPDGKCLYLQIMFENEKRVVFSASTFLMDVIKRVPKDKFGFTTTIIEKDEAYQFS